MDREQMQKYRLWLQQTIATAPPETRKALLALLLAAKVSLEAGYRPEARGIPIRSWHGLLELLANVASMRHADDALLRVTSDLLAIADRMAAPGDVLRESAEILVRALHADMYVCRLRSSHGEWKIHAAARADGGEVPMFSPSLEESFVRHPVMAAIMSGGARYVVSNDLHGLERGGESQDCMSFRAGYRSRLAFVLRERMGARHPFGLILLYTTRENGFDMYDATFLGKYARIVSLTVGRRVAVARDTLEKAAGAMAHYGNNVLNILRSHAEYCGELVEDVETACSRALGNLRRLKVDLKTDSGSFRAADEAEKALSQLDFRELSESIKGVLSSARRMAIIIKSMEKSARRPRLMHYALGRDVLELEDNRDTP